jgi:hypothetical protein
MQTGGNAFKHLSLTKKKGFLQIRNKEKREELICIGGGQYIINTETASYYYCTQW